MSRDFRVYLDDILGSISKIERYIAGMELSDFEKDDKTVDACVKNLEIIWDILKNKLPELKQQTEKILAEHDKQAP